MAGVARIDESQLETEWVSIGKKTLPSGIVPPRVPGFGIERRAMIFADAFHFSHLSEDQIPAFITEAMDQEGQLCHRAEPKPEFQTPRRDGPFFVFKRRAVAGDVAR